MKTMKSLERKFKIFVNFLIVFSLLTLFKGISYGKVTNEMIYEKLLLIEKRQAILEAQFKEFKEATNKRFEDMNKRFEELREDMNARFQEVISFLKIMTGVFGGLVVGILAFALWDRRSFIRKAKEEMDKEWEVSKVKPLIQALRELAKEDPKVAKVLKDFHLL